MLYHRNLRNAVPDYTEQIEVLKQAHKNQGDALDSGEFLSGISKEDRLVPVISLILYHGSKPWDGPKSLYDMLEFDASAKEIHALKQVLPDYRLNLIDASNIEHPERFCTSLQHVFSMLKYNTDKQKLYGYAKQHRKDFQYMDDDSMMTMLSLLGEQKRLMKILETAGNGTKEEADMCIAIDELIKDGKLEGKIEGEIEGENRLATLMDKVFKDGRVEDAKPAASSQSARTNLYKEYGLSEC